MKLMLVVPVVSSPLKTDLVFNDLGLDKSILNSNKNAKRFITGCVLALTLLLSTEVRSDSNFVRVPLDAEMSIELPKNWILLSNNQRITIDTFVESSGFRQSNSKFPFAANLYDDSGRVLALINVRFYPDNKGTQELIKGVSESDLKELDSSLKQSSAAASRAMGIRLLNWYGTQTKNINGTYVIVHEHQHSGVKDNGPTRVKGIRVWRSPNSFTITLSYVESKSLILRPVVEYITTSLQRGQVNQIEK